MKSIKVFLSLVITILFMSPVYGAKLPSAADILPERTVLLINIDDFSSLRTEAEKTSFYGLYDDPSMESFVTSVREKIKEKIKSVEDETFKNLLEVEKLPTGRISLALAMPKEESTNAEPKVLFISQWGDNLDSIKKTVDKMVAKAVEDGANRSREAYRGNDITTIRIPSESTEDSGANEPLMEREPETISYCYVDDTLMVTDDEELIKFALAHVGGSDAGTLGADEDYISSMKTTGPSHDLDIYVNIKHLVSHVSAEDPQGEDANMLKVLGFDNVVSFAFSVGLGRKPRVSVDGKALVKVNGQKRGIVKMLDLKSSALTIPKFVNSESFSVSFINIDINSAFDELFKIMAGIDPRMAAMLNSPITPPGPGGEPGLMLKQDIISHLGSQIFVAEAVDKSVSPSKSLRSEVIFALSIKDKAKLESSLSRIHTMYIAPSDPESVREFLGHTLYTISLPGFLFGAVGDDYSSIVQTSDDEITAGVTASGKLAFTITNTHLIISTEAAVEQALRRLNDPSGESLTSAKWFQMAKASMPQTAGIASISNNQAYWEYIWEGIKNESPNSPLGIFFQIEGENFDMIKEAFTLLPEFEKVKKYFGVGIFHGLSRSDGFYFEFQNTDSVESDD